MHSASLKYLHMGYLGLSQYIQRGKQTICWPGYMTRDISLLDMLEAL